MQQRTQQSGGNGEQGPQQPLDPARDFFSDWDEEEDHDDDDEVAEQPTLVLKRVCRPIRGQPPPQIPVPAEQSYNEQERSMRKNAPANEASLDDERAISDDPLDIGNMNAAHLMQLSGMRRAVRPAQPPEPEEEEWWPEGIKQTGPLPVVNLYGKEPFGRTQPHLPVVRAGERPAAHRRLKLNRPAIKITLGLLVGALLLFLVTRIVDIPLTIQILRKNLSTPFGITCALLSGVAFLLAFCIRGVRWKLFLNPVGKVSTIKAVQLFLVGIFLNFLLPIRGGEVAKSLMLKRIANIPISRSLPTVAMDKALDLMPALFIMAIVPFIGGVTMDHAFAIEMVLGMVGGLLICLMVFVGLAAWKRSAAIKLLQKMTGMLPETLGSKVEGFATGFVDALLAGASQPRIFVPAILLTLLAVIFDGLFAMLAFWTVGVHISFGTAIFGYTVYNMFYILPTPPGQVGSNEAIGLLVFYGLLHLDAHGVAAMFIFSHPWAAVLMCASGMTSLSALGLTVTSVMKVQTGEAIVTPAPEDQVKINA